MQAIGVKDFLQLPFIQVALPIMITFAFALFYQSKRMDDLKDSLGKRIDELRSDMNLQRSSEGSTGSKQLVRE